MRCLQYALPHMQAFSTFEDLRKRILQKSGVFLLAQVIQNLPENGYFSKHLPHAKASIPPLPNVARNPQLKIHLSAVVSAIFSYPID